MQLPTIVLILYNATFFWDYFSHYVCVYNTRKIPNKIECDIIVVLKYYTNSELSRIKIIY